MMKTTSAVIFLTAFSLLGCSKHDIPDKHNDPDEALFRTHELEAAAAARITESHILYIDDIGEKTVPPADEFESAFALDSACHGLTLVRWSRLDVNATPAAFAFLEKPHWNLFVVDRKVPPEFIGVRMTPTHFNGLEVAFGPVSAMKDAVHSVCFVANGRGGQ